MRIKFIFVEYLHSFGLYKYYGKVEWRSCRYIKYVAYIEKYNYNGKYYAYEEDKSKMKEEDILIKITQLLDERHWSLYRLAKEAEISYSTLSNTFQRNNVPSIPTLMKICDGLGITLSEFFDEEGSVVKRLTVMDHQMLVDYHRLSKEDKRLVTAYIQGLLKVTSLYDFEDLMEDTEGCI